MTDEVETPAEEQDQSVDDQAPEADQPEGSSEDSCTESFNPDELPEEAREGYEAGARRTRARSLD